MSGSRGVGFRYPRVDCPRCARSTAVSSDPDGLGARLRSHQPCGIVWVDPRGVEVSADRVAEDVAQVFLTRMRPR